MRPMHMKALVMVAVPLLLSACTGSDHPTAGGSSPTATQSAGASSPTKTQSATASASQMCVAGLHHPASASSLTTVRAVRAFRFGPQSYPAPGLNAFPAVTPSAISAWCTVRRPSKFGVTDTFYAVGPDGSAVRILSVSGPPGPGPVPNHPVQVP
jgi:hypothetical protein